MPLSPGMSHPRFITTSAVSNDDFFQLNESKTMTTRETYIAAR